MNRASGHRARYGRSRSSRRFQPRWIVAGGLLSAVAVVLDLPVLSADKVTGGLLLLLALLPLVITLTVAPGVPRGRVVGAAAGIVVVLGAFGGLLYNARFAPHDGYSVSIAAGASISQVQSEIRAISGSHALAADTSFSNDRIKVTFPGGDPATVAATISELRGAPGVASVRACYGTLC